MQPQKQAKAEKEFYRPDELADLLGVSCETVRRWIRREIIRHVHLAGLVRIPREEFVRVRKEGVVRSRAK